MAPLLQRSPQSPQQSSSPLTTPSPLPQDDSATTGVTSNGLSLGGILAITFGIVLVIGLAIVLASLARKRRKQSLAHKSTDQTNFFEKLAADQRAFERGTWGSCDTNSNNNRYTVWGRDSFQYAVPTGRESPRMVMENPGTVWSIKPIEPAFLR